MFITQEDLFNSQAVSEELIQTVLSDKYLGEGERTYDDVVNRMMGAVREFVDNSPNKRAYYRYMSFDIMDTMLRNKYFIPAGSILEGLGSKNSKCSFSNCYVVPIEKDSLEGIFDAKKKAARTFSYRGGVGIDFTILRPKDSIVNNAAGSSSGAVSYIPSFSDMTKLIGQGEAIVEDKDGNKIKRKKRRGAMLASLDVRHPDIIDFIMCKAYPEKVFYADFITGEYPKISGANLSVKVTNAFRDAVEKDEDWNLVFPDYEADKAFYNEHWSGNYEDWEECGGKLRVYKTMKAREIDRLIAECAHAFGDPGILYIDTIVNNSPAAKLSKKLRPETTNPCGELPLNNWGACLLGAINLPKFVDDPYTDKAHFNFDYFIRFVYNATRFMNVVSDMNEGRHPLKEQREADKFGKRIGLEATGLADMLSMVGHEYGSEKSLDTVECIFKEFINSAICASDQIGGCLGGAPAFLGVENDVLELFKQKIKRSPLSTDCFCEDKPFSLRNTSLLTMGPTGSVSIIANNCSSGIEPVFSVAYKRRTNVGGGKEFTMLHKPIVDWCIEHLDWFGEGKELSEIKEKFHIKEAHEIDFHDRIAMQAAIQKYVDSSISSTINLPSTATVDDVQEIYSLAYKSELKGVTVYRDGCKKGVLEVVTSTKIPDVTQGLKRGEPIDIPQSCCAVRQKFKHNGKSVYVTVSFGDDGGPLEVFTMLPRNYSFDPSSVTSDQLEEMFRRHWDILTRLVSLGLRYGVPVIEIVNQIQKVVPNINDAEALIARALKGFIPDTAEGDEMQCPECKADAYVFESGCAICKVCGYSKCS